MPAVCIDVRKTPDPEAVGSLRDKDTDSCRRDSTAISAGNAIPFAVARMVVAVAVPPVMATTETPTLSPDKRAGSRPDQSADGAAYHSTDNGTSYRMSSLRRRRLRE